MDTPTAPSLLWAPLLLAPTDAYGIDVLEDAVVAIADGRIAGVRTGVRSAPRGATRLDGCALLPGLVNAHAHVELAPWSGIIDGLALPEWLGRLVEVRAAASAGGVDITSGAAEAGAMECIAGGITTVLDASYSDAVPAALHAAGVRGRSYREVFAASLGPGVRSIDEAEAAPRTLPPGIDDGLSPHAPYTAGPDDYTRVATGGGRWMTHLAESPAELGFLADGSGPLSRSFGGGERPRWPAGSAPVTMLEGLLDERALLVHGVHLDVDQVEALAATGAGLVLCPRSNARLGCGLPPWRLLREAGVPLALGTDSPASAGPLDMFAEMRLLLHGVRALEQDAAAISAGEALWLATRGGALAGGYPDRGLLAEGAAADLCAIRLDAGAPAVESLVLAAHPHQVQLVLVAGEHAWDARVARSLERLAHARARSARLARELQRLASGASRAGNRGPNPLQTGAGRV